MDLPASSNPWRIAQPPPTMLMIGWGSEESPEREEVLDRLKAAVPDLEIGPQASDIPPDMLWGQPVRIGGELMGFWAQEGIDVGPGSRHGQPPVPRARWCLGVQAMTNPNSPYEWYAKVLRLVRESFPDLAYVSDVLCGAIWSPADLTAMTDSPILPDGVLWSTQVVRAASGGGQGPAWVRTAGLSRCARPELEMLEVPPHLVGAAMFLLADLADRFMHEPLPTPGVWIPVGGESSDHVLGVMLQRWQEATKSLPDNALGRAEHRKLFLDANEVAESAAVCSPQASLQGPWSCPTDVLEAVARGSFVTLQSDQVMARRGLLARFGWPELAMAFHDWRGGAPADQSSAVRFFLVTSSRPQQPEQAESLTMEIEHIDGDRAVGRAVQDSIWDRSVAGGSRIEVACRDITDWFVDTPVGRISSQHHRGLRQAIAASLATTRPNP